MRLVLIALVCSTLSFSQNKLTVKNQLRILISNSSTSPYHIHAPGNILASINMMVLGQLISSEDGFELKPEILENFYYDFKTDSYYLKLKKGLKFHNGRVATSKDLEFTLLRGFYSSDKSFFHTYLGNIAGVREIKKGDKFKSGNIKGIEIVDDLSIKVKLVGPNPSFFHSLTAPYFSLVPMEELEDDYLSWKSTPIGVGPYKVQEGFDGVKTILEDAFGNSKFDEIIIYSKNMKNVNYDISFLPINEFKTYYSNLPLCVRLLEFSNKHPLGRNPDFKTIVKKISDSIKFDESNGMAVRTHDLLPSHFWGHVDEEFKDVDVEKLIKKLNLKEIEVIVFSGGELSEKHNFYIDKFKKQFSKYNVDLHFSPNSEKFVSDETASKYPLRFQGIVSDYVDPLIMFSAYRKIGHNLNYSPLGSDVDRFEELYLKAELSKTFDDRLSSVKKLNKFAKDIILNVPISEEKMIYYINPKSIKTLGKQLNPLTINVENIVNY